MSLSPRDVILRFFDEVWSQGRIEVVDELFAPDYRGQNLSLGSRHLPEPPQPGPGGREAIKRAVVAWRTAFEDYEESVERMVCEGQYVTTVQRWRGRHVADFGGVPATFRHIEGVAMSIRRVVEERITEEWLMPDLLGLYEALGIIARGA